MAENDPKANLREQINENLKRVYEDVVNQEVPDRFKELLDKLRAIEKAAHEKAGGGKT
ncbi:MAG: NepR family anti-sigma factor [Cypionkella sp.]